MGKLAEPQDPGLAERMWMAATSDLNIALPPELAAQVTAMKRHAQRAYSHPQQKANKP